MFNYKFAHMQNYSVITVPKRRVVNIKFRKYQSYLHHFSRIKRNKFEPNAKPLKQRSSIASTEAKTEPVIENPMTQHFAKIHEPNEPQRSEVVNVQQLQSPDGNVTKTRISSTSSENDTSGHLKTIKFIEKEKSTGVDDDENGLQDKSQEFTQNVGQEIAKKLTHLGSSGKITVSSKIIKNGEVTTYSKVTNFGPKYIIPKKIETSPPAEEKIKSPPPANSNKTKLMHSPSTIKDLLLRWCRDKTQGYPNVEITNFSRSWANGLAFCALIHSYYPDAFDFNKLDASSRKKNLEIAFKTAEEKGDIYPLLEVEDMLEMKDSPDWKCIFTYVQSLYKGLKDKKHQNPFKQHGAVENGGLHVKEVGRIVL